MDRHRLNLVRSSYKNRSTAIFSPNWCSVFHALDLIMLGNSHQTEKQFYYFFAFSSNSSIYLSKSDMNNLSWMTRYFSNSVSAFALAISAVILPVSWRTSLSSAIRNKSRRFAQSSIVIGMWRSARSSARCQQLGHRMAEHAKFPLNTGHSISALWK